MFNAEEFIELFEKNVKRYHLIGTLEKGVIAGLDLEGRLYAVLNGRVLNRVNTNAICGITDRKAYLNPGGDGLWPAPEGTIFGYEYSTGAWRVPPGLTGARFVVASSSENSAVIEAEVDLINASGTGISTIFRRSVSINPEAAGLDMTVVEAIEYIGAETLTREKCMLVPWTLCQFDAQENCKVVFPGVADGGVWDLYDPSNEQRSFDGGMWSTRTDCSMRYQIAMDANTPWIEFRNPAAGLTVRRSALMPSSDRQFIDIVDAPPTAEPSDKGVRYSVYSDTNGFMEIEAAGAMPETITPGTVLDVSVRTVYSLD